MGPENRHEEGGGEDATARGEGEWEEEEEEERQQPFPEEKTRGNCLPSASDYCCSHSETCSFRLFNVKFDFHLRCLNSNALRHGCETFTAPRCRFEPGKLQVHVSTCETIDDANAS